MINKRSGRLNENTEDFCLFVSMGQENMRLHPGKVSGIPFFQQVPLPIVIQNDGAADDVDELFFGMGKWFRVGDIRGNRHQYGLNFAETGAVRQRFVQIAHFLAADFGSPLLVGRQHEILVAIFFQEPGQRGFQMVCDL